MTGSNPVRLKEHGQPEDLPLTVRQAEAIRATGLVGVEYLPDGRYRLRPGDKVGMVRVGEPHDAVDIVVAPKLTISRLVYLLGYSTGITWREELLDVPEDDELLPAIARVLATLAERALARGVLQGYTTLNDALPVVRGRLLVGEQARRRVGLALPVECRFDEWTIDIPENQILLAGARLARALPSVEEDVAQRLKRVEVQLGAVSKLSRGAPPPRWQRSRLNQRYHPALRIAELVLRHSAVQALPQGPMSFSGFVVWMPEVFESFVTQALRLALTRYGGAVMAQKSTSLDVSGRLKIKPDLEWHHRGGIAAVIDAKYKAADRVLNPDAYQLVTYCLRHGLQVGHLVYAAGQEPERTYEIRGANVTLVQHAVDLSAPTSTLLHADVARMASRINGQVDQGSDTHSR